MTDIDLMKAFIEACPQIGPGLKPCTKIVSILTGRALQFKVDLDRETPILMTLKALTDGSPPGICMALTDGNSNTETVGLFSISQSKCAEVVRRAWGKLPASMAHDLRGLISPQSLAVLFGAFALSHLTGAGELIDIGVLLIFGTTVALELVNAVITAMYATTEADLDEAAGHLAHAVSSVGTAVFVGTLLRVGRGKTESEPSFPERSRPLGRPTPPPYKTTPMKDYFGEDVPGNKYWRTPVKYLSESERAAYKLAFKNGKIYDANGRLFDTTDAATLHSGNGRAIFVMDENGNIYASKFQRKGYFHHSSLAGGEPVAAAGEIKVENGVLTVISDRSGHYRPEQPFTQQANDALQRGGIDMSKVQPDFKGR